MSIHGLGVSGGAEVPQEKNKTVTLKIEGVGEVQIKDLTGKKNKEELLNLLASKSGYLQELCQDLVKGKIIGKEQAKITLLVTKQGTIDLSMKVNNADVEIENHPTQKKILEAIQRVESAPGKRLLQKEQKERKPSVHWIEEGGDDRTSKLKLAKVGPDVYKERAFYQKKMVEKENIPPTEQKAQKANREARYAQAWQERYKPRFYRTGGRFPTEAEVKNQQERIAEYLKIKGGSAKMQEVAAARAQEFAHTLALLIDLDDIDPLNCSEKEAEEIAGNLRSCWNTLNDAQFAYFCENSGIEVYDELLDAYNSKIIALRILDDHPEFKDIQATDWNSIEDTNAALDYLEKSGYGAMVPSKERNFFDRFYQIGMDWIEELGGDRSNDTRKRFMECFAKLDARGLTTPKEVSELDPIDYTLEGLQEIHDLLSEISVLRMETLMNEPIPAYFKSRYPHYFTDDYQNQCNAAIVEFAAKIKSM
ncbi:MAG: hypothetical protein LLG04_01665 [Parachlamydia sp.]|nr:hypothetical protein [Parachlamydia sp.]